MLAPGANGGAGEIYVYYGRHDYDFPTGSVDLATAANRRLISDETAGPIQTIRVWEATFEGAEEILAGIPGATTDAGAQAGAVYIPLSPRMDISPTSLNLRIMQGITTVAPITISNISAVPVIYRLLGGAPWFTLSPASATVTVSAGATLNVSINGAALAPGEYTGGFSIGSNTRDLAMTVPISVRVRVLQQPTLTSTVTSHINIGQTVTWTATADTSAGPVEYLFRRYSPTRGWEIVRNWSTSNTYTWTPASTDSGRYVLEVLVRVVGSSAAYEAITSTGYFTVGNALPLFVFSGKADFDGDRRTDPSVFRPNGGMWFALMSGTQFATSFARAWGAVNDVPVPGDYDGDGRTDVAVYRPSNGVWYMLLSRSGYATSQSKAWGVGSDIPVPADYDGDGRTDIAIYRPANGMWFVLYSSTQYTNGLARAWGAPTDIPVPGDYDGDGKTDLAVYRPSNGTWYVLESITGYTAAIAHAWGATNDRPAPADYDGDRRTDIAVYRPSNGTWYLLYSSTGFASSGAQAWGAANDVPIPADYDGDGRADIAVFRPASGIWFVLGRYSVAWGAPNDIPLLRR
jgi:hypothetical protein